MEGQLDPKCTARLIAVCSDALEKITVRDGRYLDIASTGWLFSAENVLPKNGKVREAYENYVGDSPFFEFANDWLAMELAVHCAYVKDAPVVPLLTALGQTTAHELASRIVNDFNALPWRYELTLPLPDELGLALLAEHGPKTFSPDLRVCELDEVFRKERPYSTGSQARDKAITPARTLLGSLMMGDSREWPAQAAALVLATSGFIDRFGGTEPTKEARERIAAFLGLCLALQLLHVSAKYVPYPPKNYLVVHRLTEDGLRLSANIELDAALSKVLSSLEVAPWVRDAKPDTRRGNFKYVLDRIAIVFGDVEANRRIISAARWLLNSHAADDELLAFVQATVALEILLGEQSANEKIGLTELLRNRCAYLIANSAKERDDILKLFNEIYTVRSKIVHTGKSRLNMRESFLLSEARRLARKVIQKEVDLRRPS